MTIDDLTKSNKLKGLALDIIAHDLKNSANKIMTTTQMMFDESPHDERFKIIWKGSKQLVNVLNNALLFSEVVNEEVINKEEIRLLKIVDTFLHEFPVLGTQEKPMIVCRFSEDYFLWASPIISEVFFNYLSNAIKYCSNGNTIFIYAYQKEGYDIVKVKDFGITIPELDRESIFERGIQLSNGSKNGNGLGLFIVKTICEAHNGEAWIEPNRPEGNAFCIKIPSKP